VAPSPDAPADIHAWRGTITDLGSGREVVVRDLHTQGEYLTAPMVWTEAFARCEHPSVAVRWSDLRAVNELGAEVRPARVRVNYQARTDGGCDNTTVITDELGLVQATATQRQIPQGAVITVPAQGRRIPPRDVDRHGRQALVQATHTPRGRDDCRALGVPFGPAFAPAPSRRMMRVLVVEDERDLANALAEGIRRDGYAVDTSFDGHEALEKLSATPYDIVCLDLNLPDMDGLAVCRAIRSDGVRIDETDPPRVLMLTARDALADRVSGLDQADDFGQAVRLAGRWPGSGR
jgi:CheY-like chemotaxis protein